MLKTIIIKYISAIICILISSLNTYSQRPYQSIVFPLQHVSSDSNTTWSKAFNSKITNEINVVGLGEFTHGGHETFVSKCEIVRYLVQEKGYRQLLIEFPNVILTELNDYLLRKKPDSIDSTLALIQKAYAGIIKDKSFFDLMVWLKHYNLTHLNDMVSVKGIDIEGSDSAFADYFMYNYLLIFDSMNATDIISKAGNSKDSLTVAELKWFAKNKDKLKRDLDKSSYNELLYNFHNAADKITHKSINKYNIFKASVFRDSIMAQNVVHLATAKSIILSHNLHISTAAGFYNAGNFLKSIMGNKYFSVLTDFSDEATVWVINDKNLLIKKHFLSNKKTIAATIKKESNINEGIVFFNDLKQMGASTSTNSIDKNGRQQVIGRGQPFDALIFFNKVSPCM